MQQELLEHLVGQPLSVSQWLQARLPIKWGGLGLLSSRYEVGMRIFHVADLAYLTARHRSHAHVNRLVPGYTPSIARDFELQPDNTLVFFLSDQEDVSTLLSLSINLPSCNSCTRLSTKIFSKGVVWPTKRGFELSPLPEQGHGFMPLLHPPVIWYSLILHFRILSVCDWEYLFSGKVWDIFITINP